MTHSTYPYLDRVRGLASQAVVVGHTLNIFFPSIFMVRRPDGFLEARHDIPLIQNLGVVAFFAISGFLVARSADRGWARGKGLTDFTLARATRIFVPYWPFLLILLLAERSLYGADGSSPFQVLELGFGTLIANAAMLFNDPAMAIAAKVTGLPLSHGSLGTAQQLWTVVLEWWIYVVFGLFFFAARTGERWSAARIIVLATALPVPLWSLLQGSGLILAWIVGMGMWLLGDLPTRLSVRAAWALVVATAGMAVARSLLSHFAFYDPVFVLSASIALLAAGRLVGRAPAGRVVAWASDISYSLYLVHLPLLVAATTIWPRWRGDPAMAAVMMLFCNLVAFAYWWGVERHYGAVLRKIIGWKRSRFC